MFDQKVTQEKIAEIQKRIAEFNPEITESTKELQALDAIVRINDVNTDLIGGVVETMQSNVNNVGRIINTLNVFLDEIKYLHEHIRELYKIIHELAPDYEIIETMAETAEERAAMCNAYMNHGEWSNAADDTEHEKRDQS